MISFDRRQALAVGGLACATACSGGRTAAPPPAGADLAALADLPVGTLVVRDKVVLRRTSDTEVTAFTAVCPHAGCAVRVSGDVLICPCHGSEFDATGAVTQGPADRDLAPVAVVVTDGIVRTA